MVRTISSRSWVSWGSALALMMLTSACGGSGTAKLQFAQATGAPALKQGMPFSASALTDGTPITFKKKLIAAYLAEDVDSVTQNNIGKTSMFWLNTECADDISNCNVFSPDSSGGTSAHVITSLFDFTDLSATNAALNSQGRSIDTGTYRYVRIEFCKYGAPDGNDAKNGGQYNIEWSYNDGTHGLQTGKIAEDSCSSTAALATPIEVKNGDAVTVTLSYSLADKVSVSTNGSPNCTTNYCFNTPVFTPSATK